MKVRLFGRLTDPVQVPAPGDGDPEPTRVFTYREASSDVPDRFKMDLTFGATGSVITLPEYTVLSAVNFPTGIRLVSVKPRSAPRRGTPKQRRLTATKRIQSERKWLKREGFAFASSDKEKDP